MNGDSAISCKEATEIKDRDELILFVLTKLTQIDVKVTELSQVVTQIKTEWGICKKLLIAVLVIAASYLGIDLKELFF